MRCTSAAHTKTGHFRGQLVPREGTRIRQVYDRLMAERGKPVATSFAGDANQSRLRQLRDFYGLDIRCLRPGLWVVAGEWFGRTYVDYIAPHVVDRKE